MTRAASSPNASPVTAKNGKEGKAADQDERIPPVQRTLDESLAAMVIPTIVHGANNKAYTDFVTGFMDTSAKRKMLRTENMRNSYFTLTFQFRYTTTKAFSVGKDMILQYVGSALQDIYNKMLGGFCDDQIPKYASSTNSCPNLKSAYFFVSKGEFDSDSYMKWCPETHINRKYFGYVYLTFPFITVPLHVLERLYCCEEIRNFRQKLGAILKDTSAYNASLNLEKVSEFSVGQTRLYPMFRYDGPPKEMGVSNTAKPSFSHFNFFEEADIENERVVQTEPSPFRSTIQNLFSGIKDFTRSDVFPYLWLCFPTEEPTKMKTDRKGRLEVFQRNASNDSRVSAESSASSSTVAAQRMPHMVKNNMPTIRDPFTFMLRDGPMISSASQPMVKMDYLESPDVADNFVKLRMKTENINTLVHVMYETMHMGCIHMKDTTGMTVKKIITAYEILPKHFGWPELLARDQSGNLLPPLLHFSNTTVSFEWTQRFFFIVCRYLSPVRVWRDTSIEILICVAICAKIPAKTILDTILEIRSRMAYDYRSKMSGGSAGGLDEYTKTFFDFEKHMVYDHEENAKYHERHVEKWKWYATHPTDFTDAAYIKGRIYYWREKSPKEVHYTFISLLSMLKFDAYVVYEMLMMYCLDQAFLHSFETFSEGYSNASGKIPKTAISHNTVAALIAQMTFMHIMSYNDSDNINNEAQWAEFRSTYWMLHGTNIPGSVYAYVVRSWHCLAARIERINKMMAIYSNSSDHNKGHFLMKYVDAVHDAVIVTGNVMSKKFRDILQNYLRHENAEFHSEYSDKLTACTNAVIEEGSIETVIREGNPEDYICQCTGHRILPITEYNKKDVEEVFLFPIKCTGEIETGRSLQCLFGSFFRPGNPEKKLHILAGLANGGKSALGALLMRALGMGVTRRPYATTMSIEAMLVQTMTDASGASPQWADKHGIRVITISETEPNQLLSSTIVKAHTGNTDVISTRGLYKDPKPLRVLYKILILTNTPPRAEEESGLRVRLTVWSIKASFVEHSELNQELDGQMYPCQNLMSELHRESALVRDTEMSLSIAGPSSAAVPRQPLMDSSNARRGRRPSSTTSMVDSDDEDEENIPDLRPGTKFREGSSCGWAAFPDAVAIKNLMGNYRESATIPESMLASLNLDTNTYRADKDFSSRIRILSPILLSLMVEWNNMYRVLGVPETKTMREETEKYWTTSNPMRQFKDTCMVRVSGPSKITFQDAYLVFKKFCEAMLNKKQAIYRYDTFILKLCDIFGKSKSAEVDAIRSVGGLVNVGYKLTLANIESLSIENSSSGPSGIEHHQNHMQGGSQQS